MFKQLRILLELLHCSPTRPGTMYADLSGKESRLHIFVVGSALYRRCAAYEQEGCAHTKTDWGAVKNLFSVIALMMLCVAGYIWAAL
jgi:hypothetical protein